MGKQEDPIHLGVLELMRWRLPGALIHHSPNELNLGDGWGDEEAKRQMRRSKAIAQTRAKKMGMEPGFPDLIALWRGLFLSLETKVPLKGPTADQLRIGGLIIANGGKWAVVRSVDEADRYLREWMKGARA